MFLQLPGGPKHRKTVSMPDALYDDVMDYPGGVTSHDITVSRSHSDSHKHAEGALEVASEAQTPNRVRIKYPIFYGLLSYCATQ